MTLEEIIAALQSAFGGDSDTNTDEIVDDVDELTGDTSDTEGDTDGDGDGFVNEDGDGEGEAGELPGEPTDTGSGEGMGSGGADALVELSARVDALAKSVQLLMTAGTPAPATDSITDYLVRR